MRARVVRLETFVDPGLLNEISGRLRASIALLVIMLFLIAGLVMIRIASRSWRRVDDYLRQSARRPAAPQTGSAWEASGQRLRRQPSADDDENSEDTPDGDDNAQPGG